MDLKLLGEIRQRNAYRLEKRKHNDAAGLLKHKSKQPSAIDDIEMLLQIIEELLCVKLR